MAEAGSARHRSPWGCSKAIPLIGPVRPGAHRLRSPRRAALCDIPRWPVARGGQGGILPRLHGRDTRLCSRRSTRKSHCCRAGYQARRLGPRGSLREPARSSGRRPHSRAHPGSCSLLRSRDRAVPRTAGDRRTVPTCLTRSDELSAASRRVPVLGSPTPKSLQHPHLFIVHVHGVGAYRSRGLDVHLFGWSVPTVFGGCCLDATALVCTYGVFESLQRVPRDRKGRRLRVGQVPRHAPGVHSRLPWPDFEQLRRS